MATTVPSHPGAIPAKILFREADGTLTEDDQVVLETKVGYDLNWHGKHFTVRAVVSPPVLPLPYLVAFEVVVGGP